MAGTIEGGRKAAAKNLASDPDFYRKIGAKGAGMVTLVVLRRTQHSLGLPVRKVGVSHGGKRIHRKRGRSLMLPIRTQDEIEQRAKKQFTADGTGFEWTMYIDYLDFDRAKSIVPTLTEEQWQPAHEHATSTPIIKQMQTYMAFAEKKASEGRNLSAQRSLRHYMAWFWLTGNDEMVETIETFLTKGQYTKDADYGIEMLGRIKTIIGSDESKRIGK